MPELLMEHLDVVIDGYLNWAGRSWLFIFIMKLGHVGVP